METIILFSQTVVTACLAGWLTLGVRDNLTHPAVNETYTAEVLSMVRMQREYPELFAQVSHRAITDRKTQQAAFKLVVAVELLSVLVLWIGTLALAFAVLGAAAPDTARALALLGATAFFCTWAAMLIVGNHFCYWLCHDGAQNTHYQMALWGLGAMILLVLGG